MCTAGTLWPRDGTSKRDSEGIGSRGVVLFQLFSLFWWVRLVVQRKLTCCAVTLLIKTSNIRIGTIDVSKLRFHNVGESNIWAKKAPDSSRPATCYGPAASTSWLQPTL